MRKENMGLLALICPYCGGKIQPDGDKYICPFCGNTVILCPDPPMYGSDRGSDRNGRAANNRRFSFKAALGGVKRDYTNVTELTINLEYRRRTSMADRNPMTASIYVDGVKTQVSDAFENVGKGTIKIWYDGKQFNMDNGNGVRVFVNDRISSSLESFGDKDTINVGSLSVSFKG